MKTWKILFGLGVASLLSVIGIKVANNFMYLPQYLLPIYESFYFYLVISVLVGFFGLWLKKRRNAIKLIKTSRTLFGEIKWQAPSWVDASIERGVFQSISHYMRSAKIWIMAFLLFTAIGGYEFLSHLANKPRVSDKVASVEKSVSITVSAPSSTYFYKGAQGEPALTTYPLKLNFSGNAADLKMRDKVVEQGISIAPSLKGQWKWEGQDSLVFKPQADWAVGENYVVSFEKSLFAENVMIHDSQVRFKTEPFKGYSSSSEFYENPLDPLDKKVVSSFTFSHPVELEDLKGHVTVNLFYKVGDAWSFQRTIDFQVIKNEIGLSYAIHTQKVSLLKEAQKISVVVSPSLMSKYANKNLFEEINADTVIPSINQFYYFDRPGIQLIENKSGEQEQVLFLKASTAVKADEVAKFVEVFELPKTKRSFSDPMDIPSKVFAAKKLVSIVPMPSQREFAKEHFLKLEVPQGVKLLITLKEGLPSFEGYQLAQDFSYIATVPNFTSVSKVIPNGNILRLEGDGQVSLMLRNVKKAKLEISQVLKNQVHHYLMQNRGSMEKPEFESYGFNEKYFSRTIQEEVSFPSQANPNKSFYSVIDLKKILRQEFSDSKGRGFFILKVKKDGDYRPSDQRLIVLSDYAMIAKRQSDSSYQVFVYNITSQKPASGVKVEVMGPNGLPLFTRQSNSEGVASFPNLRPTHNDPRPVAFIARKGNNISFMKVDDYNRRLYYYSNDISGQQEYGDVSNKLKAFVFSDRKMYRPGEKAWFSSIIKDGIWSTKSEDQPIEYTLTDPNGRAIFKTMDMIDEYGMNQLSYQFSPNDKTGSYSLSVNLIGEGRRRTFLGSTSIKVEEFQPDRIKIQANFKSTGEKAWLDPNDVTVLASLRNLFGTPVTASRVKISQKLFPTALSFAKYPDFKFSHFNQIKKSVTLDDIELTTDEKGMLTHQFNLEKFNQNTFRFFVDVEGFEKEGGRSVRTKVNQLVSSHKFLLGVKKEKLNFIKQGQDQKIEFLAVDADLKPFQAQNLKVEMIQKRPIRTLVRQSNGTYKYENLIKKEIVEVNALQLEKGRSSFSLNTEKTGNYFLKVIDVNNNILAQVDYSIVGKAKANLYERESELEIKLSKSDYNAGETIEVEVKSPYAGAGLLTIERDKVYTSKWFQINGNSKTLKVRLPKNLEGNAYVNVLVIKSTKAKEVLVNPISFQVANFSINRDKRKLAIEVSHDQLVKPDTKLNIRYKANQKSKMILFGVDEGILQVAKYQTPNPLAYFFAKKALSVVSFQTLDLILADARSIRKYAPGGGSRGALASNLNPFARKAMDPVVFWSEVLEAGPKEKTYTYQVPDYFNGQMRIIAVAVNDDKIGVHKSFVTVRGDLIIMPNVPTFVAPGDQFEVSVILANNIKKGERRKVRLEVRPSANLKVLENADTSKEIESLRDEVYRIKLQALDELGASEIHFTASSEEYQAKLKATSSVRPPVHYQFSVWAGELKEHQQDIKFTRDLFPHLADQSAVVSQNPLLALDSVAGYLSKYPYGCSEQIISKAFAASILGLKDGSRISKKQTLDFHRDALRIINGRMDYDGIALYPGVQERVGFIPLYAYFYVKEAKKRFLEIPSGLEKSLMGLIRRVFNNTDIYLEKAMATYLLSKYSASRSSFLARAEKFLESDNRLLKMNHLGHLFMAAAYQVVGKEKKALSYLEKYKFNQQEFDRFSFYHTRHLHNTLGLYLLAEHFSGSGRNMDQFVLEVMGRISSEVNSLSLAMSFLALDSYFNKKTYSPLAGLEIVKKGLDQNQKSRDEKVAWNGVQTQKLDLSQFTQGLYLKNPQKAPFYFSINRSGFDKNNFQSELVSGVQITKSIFDEQNSPLTRVRIGEEVIVEIAIQNKDGKNHDNMAVVDLLPGGFEPLLEMSEGNKVDLASASYFDRREDRIVFYLPMTSGDGTKILRYRMKAVNVGSYILPGAFAEDMYDVKVRARSKAKRVEVAK